MTMATLRSILSGAAKVGGAGFAGYGADKREMVAQALADAKAKREAENDRIRNLVAVSGIDPVLQGRLAGARASAEVGPAVERAKALLPIDVQRAVETAKGVTPIQTEAAQQTHAANRQFDIEHPEVPLPSFSATTIGGDPSVPGSGEVITYNTRTGERGTTLGAAKPNASNAKLTESQEKSYLFYNLMKNAEPEIIGALASARIRPTAVSTYLGANSVADIPVVGKAVGAVAKPLANANLNEEEQKLIRAGKDFAAGVLRKESGAAVTNSELMETMERYFPGMFGDKPGMTEAKNRARQQYMQTMEQEATPAIQYYSRQKPGAGTPPPPAVPSFEEWLAKRGGTP